MADLMDMHFPAKRVNRKNNGETRPDGVPAASQDLALGKGPWQEIFRLRSEKTGFSFRNYIHFVQGIQTAMQCRCPVPSALTSGLQSVYEKDRSEQRLKGRLYAQG
jgi:hypothetical protein